MRESVEKENSFMFFLRKKIRRKENFHVWASWAFHTSFCLKTQLYKKQSQKPITPQNLSILVIPLLLCESEYFFPSIKKNSLIHLD